MARPPPLRVQRRLGPAQRGLQPGNLALPERERRVGGPARRGGAGHERYVLLPQSQGGRLPLVEGGAEAGDLVVGGDGDDDGAPGSSVNGCFGKGRRAREERRGMESDLASFSSFLPARVGGGAADPGERRGDGGGGGDTVAAAVLPSYCCNSSSSCYSSCLAAEDGEARAPRLVLLSAFLVVFVVPPPPLSPSFSVFEPRPYRSLCGLQGRGRGRKEQARLVVAASSSAEGAVVVRGGEGEEGQVSKKKKRSTAASPISLRRGQKKSTPRSPLSCISSSSLNRRQRNTSLSRYHPSTRTRN